MLPGHHPDPGCEVSSAAKGCPVADSSNRRAGDQRAEAGNLPQAPAKRILTANALDLVGNGFDIDIQLLPLLPETLQQPAPAWSQIVLGIFQHQRQVLAELDRSGGEGNTAFQQKSADLVDECGATLHQAVTDAVHGLDVELL